MLSLCEHHGQLYCQRRASSFKPLNCQSQQLSSALSSACDFKSHFCKYCGPRSDCSDLGPHCLLVCKNRLENFARIFSRRHEQTTFSDAGFLGVLRVKIELYKRTASINIFKTLQKVRGSQALSLCSLQMDRFLLRWYRQC